MVGRSTYSRPAFIRAERVSGPDKSRTMRPIQPMEFPPRTAISVSASRAQGRHFQDRLDNVDVVIDAKLIGHGQEHSLGFGNGFVFRKLAARASGSAA